jgi:hypothetical protein
LFAIVPNVKSRVKQKIKKRKEISHLLYVGTFN